MDYFSDKRITAQPKHWINLPKIQGLLSLTVLLLVAVSTGCSNTQTTSQPVEKESTTRSSNQPFVAWLKEYIPAEYPGAEIDDHGGWFQGHVAPNLVASWAEWNEEGITLAGVHALVQGKPVFVEKSDRENWTESTSVKYYEGAGYYLSGYDSTTMANWSVQGNTVVQFDGDPGDFIKKMVSAWGGSTKTARVQPTASDVKFVGWLKDYIPTRYSDAKIDDHGGWFQGHVAPDVVVSWAEWNEEGITLSGVHSLDQGEAVFVDKKNKESWPESASVRYFDGVGYYITGYDSTTMANWNVQYSTVAQLRGNHKQFVEEMAEAWLKAQ